MSDIEDLIEKAADLIEAWLRSGYDTSDDDGYQATIIAQALADAGLLPTETEWGVSHHCHTGCPAGDEHISSEDFGGSEGIARSLVADDPERLALVTRNVTPWKDAS